MQMNTQYLDLLTKACDEIVSAKEAIANAESKIAYIREQIKEWLDGEFEEGITKSYTLETANDIPQPRVSRVKEILAGGVSKAQESAQQGQLQEFNYQGKSLDYGLLNGEPVFNLNAVAELLGLTNPRMSVDTSDEDYCIKADNSIVSLTYNRKLHNTGELFLTEAGLYKLLMRSDKPEAEAFQKWVTKDVLPSIRKTGTYQITPAQAKEVFNLTYETLCRDAILKVVKDSEVQHNAKAKGIKEYTITEKMKKGKVYTDCEVGIEWDRPIPRQKPIITRGYLPKEQLRQESLVMQNLNLR